MGTKTGRIYFIYMHYFIHVIRMHDVSLSPIAVKELSVVQFGPQTLDLETPKHCKVKLQFYSYIEKVILAAY